jgi:hypothetical protein
LTTSNSFISASRASSAASARARRVSLRLDRFPLFHRLDELLLDDGDVVVFFLRSLARRILLVVARRARVLARPRLGLGFVSSKLIELSLPSRVVRRARAVVGHRRRVRRFGS